MNLKKGLLHTMAMGIVFAGMMCMAPSSQATINNPGKLLKMNIPTYRKSGYAYRAGIQNATQSKEQHMWKIYEYNTNEKTIMNQNNGFYCLKMGVGFGSAGGTATQERTYTISADMINPEGDTDKEIIQAYKDTLPATANYDAVLWILQNAYIPAPSKNPTDKQVQEAIENKRQLLQSAGIRSNSPLYQDTDISNDLIDIVQQIAIWHFTNDDQYSGDFTSIVASLDNRNYQSLENIINNWDIENDEQLNDLFDYFVTNAEGYARQVNATSSTTRTTEVKPIPIIKNSIKLTEEGATVTLHQEENGDPYYIAGPYVITQTGGIEDSLTEKLVATDGTEITHTLLGSDKQPTNKPLKELVGQPIYLKIPYTKKVEDAKFKVSMKVKESTITYWQMAGNLTNEQPVAEVVPGEKTLEAEVILKVQNFDLALRKYITHINGNPVNPSREPQITAETKSDLDAGRIQTVTKEHTKKPIEVNIGDTVRYAIRIYNEGNISGYATEITDYLPAGLTLKTDSAINNEYGWENPSGDGKTVVTTKLANRLLNKFDGTTIDSDIVEIECIVSARASEATQNLKNVAEITKHLDENRQEITDRDSIPNNLTDDQKSKYKPGTSEQGWGYEDDDDYEELLIPGKRFDLALRKFIEKINNNPVSPSREPQVSEETKLALKNGAIETLTKEHTKTPLKVKIGDTVVYTIRIYNEGELDGYATEITDYLPAGLTLKEASEINDEYGWTNPSGDGKTIVTTKLANRLLQKFNKDTLRLDSADVQVECIVTAEATTSTQSLKNIAEITKHADENKQEITDQDSTPENLGKDLKENYNPGTSEQGWGYEDDDDYEELYIPAKTFDLALRKFITNINGKELFKEDGTTYLREPDIDLSPLQNGTGTTAIYRHPKNPIGVSEGNIVIYTLRIYNEGETDGYASLVTDYLPPQLSYINDEFNASYGWEIDSTGRVATTKHLARPEIDPEDTLIKAFDGELHYRELKIKCKVESVENLDKVITNIAEVTQYCDKDGNTNVIDRDSTADSLTKDNSKPTDNIPNDNLPADEDLPDYKGKDSNKSILTDSTYHYEGQQDDDDFEKLILENFDLALRKFITKVNETPVTDRVPVFTNTKDKNGNYIYDHTKEPVEVDSTDIVEYTLRIYNEGDIAGYAKEIKDNIPSGLEFLPNHETNKEYRWIMLDEEGKETTEVTKAKYITTDYLSKEQEKTPGENLITPFDQDKTSPDYKDVKVAFKVIALNSYEGIITNIAEISDDSDEEGKPVEDNDSTPDNGDEKEDDIDKEHIKLSYFDLALRKFITAVNSTEITNRIPVFKIDENGNYVYEHTKEPVEVENGNIVTYTLRIFNEGTKDGYAKEIKDDLPEGLEFLPEHETNKEYRWVMIDEKGEETTDITKAVSIKTDYLSKEQEEETGRDNLLTKFNPETMKEPNSRDVKIAFKVTEPNTSDRILINKAQISDDSDKDGNEIIDKDSTPDKWIEGEDDQDIEKVKVKYFDLALRKWVTQAIVIDNGKETVTDTGHKAEDDPEEVVKVEIKESRLNKVVVKFRYKIRVTNEGEIPGYATEISDYIPEGLKFIPEDNKAWKQVDGKIVTDQLKDTLLQPGQSAEVEVLLTWINGKDNFGLKINVAEISKDKNDSDTPDIDSTPNNQKPGEDDIDDAPVILSIKTGAKENMQYMILLTGSLGILATSAILIKKYVLL